MTAVTTIRSLQPAQPGQLIRPGRFCGTLSFLQCGSTGSTELPTGNEISLRLRRVPRPLLLDFGRISNLQSYWRQDLHKRLPRPSRGGKCCRRAARPDDGRGVPADGCLSCTDGAVNLIIVLAPSCGNRPFACSRCSWRLRRARTLAARRGAGPVGRRRAHQAVLYSRRRPGQRRPPSNQVPPSWPFWNRTNQEKCPWS